MTAALVSALHLLGLGVGLGALFARGRAFGRGDLDGALYADNWWGLASIFWIGTGLWRAFGGLEKGTAFYLANSMFLAKMGILGLMAALEMWPMITLLRWRFEQARGKELDTRRMPVFATINRIQTLLLVAMVFVASLMARGIGMG